MPWNKLLSSGSKGKQAEMAARRYLQQQGLKFIEQNYHCRTGEIDLIMQQDDELVFVEVKFRSDNRHGHASELLSKEKLRKLHSAIQYYLQTKKLNPAMIAHRLDLVAIEKDQIQWIQGV